MQACRRSHHFSIAGLSQAWGLMSIRGVSPVDLEQAPNGQVGIEVVDRSGGAVEQRGDAACCDDGHRFVPLSLYARDHSLDERNMTPENARLHGADGVVTD